MTAARSPRAPAGGSDTVSSWIGFHQKKHAPPVGRQIKRTPNSGNREGAHGVAVGAVPLESALQNNPGEVVHRLPSPPEQPRERLSKRCDDES